MPGAVWFESRWQFLLAEHCVIAFLGFCRRDVADGFQRQAMVEPIDPGQRGEYDRREAMPRAAGVDSLGPVKTVDRLRKGVVVAVNDTADGGFDASHSRASGEADTDVL